MSKVFEGKDLEEALHTAAAALRTSEPELDYEIVDQGRRGVFGLGARNVKIRIKPPVHELSDQEIHPSAEERPRRRRRRGKGARDGEATAEKPTAQESPKQDSDRGAAGEEQREEPKGRSRRRSRGRGRRGRGQDKGEPAGEKSQAAERTSSRGRGRGRRRQREDRGEDRRPREDRAPRPPAPEEAVAAVHSKTVEMFRLMNFDVDIKAEGANGGVMVAVDGADVQELTKRKGELMAAVQFVLNRMQRRAFPEAGRIRVACDSQRRERDNELVELTREVAQQVFQTGEAKTLHPMNAYERRLVHLTTREFEGVDSNSEGDGAVKTVRIFKDA